MKKKFLAVLAAGLFFLCITGLANADLTTIGTATYDDGSGVANYNLIWDDDNNGNSVIWLDYTNDSTNWTDQNAWAAGLDSALTISTPGYTVSWDGAWRLPSTVDGPIGTGTYGYEGDPENDGVYTYTNGYNLENSEMGHLFYAELGNKGYYDTNGVPVGEGNYGLNNTGDFSNLSSSAWYWSSTACELNPGTGMAWVFGPEKGYQYYYFYEGWSPSSNEGLAVHTGTVSAVPVPGAVWLLGSGLLGLIGIRRKTA